MYLRIGLFLLFLCCSSVVFSQALTQLEGISIDEAEFYIFDVTDQQKKAFPSVDAYRHQEKLYIALTPLFEGLRVKYSLIGNTLTVDFDGKTTQLMLNQQSDSQGQWFNDGSFYFIQSEIIEQILTTKVSINTNSLKLDLSEHSTEFPYKILDKRKKQRRINNFIIEEQYQENKTSAGVITVPDQYRLATVPSGFLSLEYQANDVKEDFSGVLQTVSDLAYHSTSITLNHESNQTDSRVEFARYPQHPGDKIFGIWDTYSFGDVWTNRSNLLSGSSRGLGLKFSANNINNQHENMTTSFVITAQPGWEADIFRNAVFIESRVVPNDGLMEFTNMELQYGANEFKIVLFGPYGEQETVFERVSVRQNSLAKGDTAFGMSFIEQDSSLLDINLSEFDIDNMSADFNIGIFDNWQLGATVNVQNNNSNSNSLLLKNQVILPGWFFENQLSISEAKLEQNTTMATSFSNLDNFTFQYKSSSQEVTDFEDLKTSYISANYNIRTGSVVNSLRYEVNDQGLGTTETATHRISTLMQFLNVSHSVTYITSDNADDSLFGNLNISARINTNFRFNSSIPYDLRADKQVDAESINASLSYNYRDSSDNRHVFNVSNTSFFKENNWSVGYNLSVLAPTHQLTLRSNYNSQDKWQVTVGISVNFGYDYFNNKLLFSNDSSRSAGSLDAHAYLDRRLNGIPDVLDYDLSDVTFIGKKQWEGVKTNSNGRARLFDANSGITALSTKWKTGGTTLNNDYLIYNHPGSVQKINLPFYLTTELEFFVVLNNEDQSLSLSNVPLVVSNKSTGDEYRGESDFDGYASFNGLLPGKYQVYIDKQYLADKGFRTDVGGFEFNSPLKGGFVVLPNIELSRSESGDIGANRLKLVTLDENNFLSLLADDNDKLIHLPPKGAMKAPYSLDSLHLAKFKEIKMQSTEQERRELRNKLAVAAESTRQFQPALSQTNTYALPVEVGTLSANNQQAAEAFDTQLELKKDSGTQGSQVIVTALKPNGLSSVQNAPPLIADNLSNQSLTVKQPDTKLDLSSGYVVQFSALKSLDIATSLAQNFSNVAQLHIVRKMVKGESMYCLISQVFQDNTSAREFLNTSSKDGFIVDATLYLDTIWSNY
jgi:hypothetical protein